VPIARVGAMASMLRQLGASMARIPKENPFAFGAVFSCAKTAAADWMVQKFVEKREELDVRRTLSFSAFGLFYLGGVQYALYVPVFGRIFPNAAAFAAKPLAEKLKDPAGMRNVLAQVFIDQCVHHPFMYFPVFYAVREVVGGNSLVEARERYVANLKEDLFALWKIWVPPTILNFAFSPMWMRIPVVATTSLVWTCVLSAMRGANDEVALPTVTAGSPVALLRDSRRTTLKPDSELVVISATGPDRVGVVSELSRAVTAGGGNVYESRMLKLGSEFTVMMLVEVEPTKATDLKMHMAGTTNDFTVTTRTFAHGKHASADDEHTYAMRLVGPDAPGILAKVSKAFSEHGLSFSSLHCDSRVEQEKDSSSLSDKPLFVMEATLTSTIEGFQKVQAEIQELAKALGVEIELTEAAM